ncbi:MAG: cytochrome c [Candidatus Elarobacter sp.]
MQSKALACLAAGAIAALIAAGCSKGTDQSSTTTTTSGTAASAPAAASAMSGTTAKVAAMGDVAHGKQIFGANCSACHGATGIEGGVGPSLKGEKNRKNYAQAIAWIHNPKPPMPKLWPQPLNDKDVSDVATYVESL